MRTKPSSLMACSSGCTVRSFGGGPFLADERQSRAHGRPRLLRRAPRHRGARLDLPRVSHAGWPGASRERAPPRRRAPRGADRRAVLRRRRFLAELGRAPRARAPPARRATRRRGEDRAHDRDGAGAARFPQGRPRSGRTRRARAPRIAVRAQLPAHDGVPELLRGRRRGTLRDGPLGTCRVGGRPSQSRRHGRRSPPDLRPPSCGVRFRGGATTVTRRVPWTRCPLPHRAGGRSGRAPRLRVPRRRRDHAVGRQRRSRLALRHARRARLVHDGRAHAVDVLLAAPRNGCGVRGVPAPLEAIVARRARRRCPSAAGTHLRGAVLPRGRRLRAGAIPLLWRPDRRALDRHASAGRAPAADPRSGRRRSRHSP